MRLNTVKVKKEGKYGFNLQVCLGNRVFGSMAYHKIWTVHVVSDFDFAEVGFKITLGALPCSEHDCESVICNAKQFSDIAAWLEKFRDNLRLCKINPPQVMTVKQVKEIAEKSFKQYAKR